MNDAGARWEHYEHDADIGIRGFGSTRATAFQQAALALTAVVVDPASVALRDHVSIQCEAPDDELLLTEWLNAIVYEMATRNMLFGYFSVRIDDNAHVRRLHAYAWGEHVDVERHRPAVEVKGATLTTLRVAHDERGAWVAQTVVDV